MKSIRVPAAASVAAALVMALAAVAQARSYSVLHTFHGKTDGATPMAGLIQDATGNFYGTTNGGGAYNAGTVFKLSKTGKETVLHSFKGGADGRNPSAGVIQDAKRSLYGTTTGGGGCGCGTVFRVNRSGKKIILHRFGGNDGSQRDSDPGFGRKLIRHDSLRRLR